MTSPSALIIHRRRSWVVALLGFVLAFVVLGFGEAEPSPQGTDGLPTGSQSARVVELDDRFPQADGSTAVVLFHTDAGELTAEQRAVATDLFVQVLPAGVTGVGGPPLLIPSEDGTALFGVVPVEAAGPEANAEAIDTLRRSLREGAPAGLTAEVTGPAAIQADLGAVFDGADLRLLGATATVVTILLLVTYRSPILWVIPLTVVAVADRVAVAAATHALAAAGLAWDGSTTGILSVLVFGAGTNYALLLISRYRDELRRHESRVAAMRAAHGPTCEAVISSAVTVVAGVLTLLLSLTPTTRGLGLASAVGIVVAAFAVLVVLPAFLVLFGRWVFWPLTPRVGQRQLVDSNTVFARVGRVVAAHPGRLVAATLVLLAVMSVGLTQVRTGLSQSDQFLRPPEAITAADRLAQSFPAGSADPAVVITGAPGQDVVTAAQQVAGVSSAAVSATAGELTRVEVVLSGDPSSEPARDSVRALRAELADLPRTWVGGTEAQAIDVSEAAGRDRVLLFPMIAGLVLLALMVLLRSVLAPVILIATVVATFLAALGASWWLFTGVLGFQALDDTTPLYAFLFLVALGVDYNIFLVTRAREEGDEYGSRTGMLRALTATGGVITSAGILLAAVFAVLGVLPLVVLAQIGVVICLGVLLDTLLVRTVLVPSIAVLLGDRFWWPRQVSRRSAPASPAGR